MALYDPEGVRAFYNRYGEREWNRLETPFGRVQAWVTARFLEELLRSGRKRGAGVLLLTQAIGDLLGANADPDAARATRAALANAAAVFLMRQQNQREVAMLRELYRLGEEEARLLLACGRGEGLLVEGRRRVSVLVDVPRGMHATFATNPDHGAAPSP